MKKNTAGKSTISIRYSIIILFIACMIITVSYILFAVFSNWIIFTDENIKIIAKNTNNEIYNQISEFIHNPIQINEANSKLLNKGIVDIDNESQREFYFSNVLKSHDGNYLYGFSLGMETGEYYGARKNEDGEIEVIRNNSETGGELWYYSLTEELSTKELVTKSGKYDPRTREWYIYGREIGKTTYSNVYKYFLFDDMAISAVSPIYDNTGKLIGVLATHVTLSILEDFLKDILEDRNTIAFIVEKESGNLIANSIDLDNYKLLNDDTVRSLNIEESNNEAIIQAYYAYKDEGIESYKLESEDGNQYININEYHKEELDWIFITATSDSIYTEGIKRNMKQTVLFVLAALAVSIFICLKFTYNAFKPMANLIETTEKFAKGNLLQRAIVFRNDELGMLTKSFNKMADTMHLLVNNLEDKVQERTLELDKTNNELRENVEQIKYLSYHDSLTGLYNRKYFEDEILKLDKKENLPISIIFSDVNGLKLTNDIFGHATGDNLLKKSAEVLKKACRAEDIVARMGGDEFAIILPRTDDNAVKKIIDRVKNELSNEHIKAIKCSMSIGHDTKITEDQELIRTMEKAEEEMYKEKTVNRGRANAGLIKTIIETLHENSPREKQHSVNVSKLCVRIGRAMNLSAKEIRKLRGAGFLHDIGKIVLKEETINKIDVLNSEENKEMQQHALVGYRILNLFEETMNLAEAVIGHHEKWDGTGYPNRLKGDEIPVTARIIAIAEAYDVMTSPSFNKAITKEQALHEIKTYAGKNFDPDIVEKFIEMMTLK